MVKISSIGPKNDDFLANGNAKSLYKGAIFFQKENAHL